MAPPTHPIPQPPRRRPSTPDILGKDGPPVRLVNEPPSPTHTTRTEASSVFEIPTFPLPRITAWVSDQAASTGKPRVNTNMRQPSLAVMTRDTVLDRPIPENEAVTTVASSTLANTHDIINFENPSPSVLSKLSRFSVEASMLTPNTSYEVSPISSVAGPAGFLPHRPAPNTLGGYHTSVLSSPTTSAASSAVSPSSSAVPASKSTPLSPPDALTGDRSSSLPGRAKLDVALSPLTLPLAAEFDDGMVLPEDWHTVVSDGGISSANSAKGMREADCSIGPKSSLYQMKGFCQGAQAYKAGGHWQGVKKTSGYVAVRPLRL
jgi:hypothetical protein